MWIGEVAIVRAIFGHAAHADPDQARLSRSGWRSGSHTRQVISGRGVEDSAALGHRGDRVDEVAQVSDAVFQQVSDASGCPGEQLRCRAGLDVLGENQHADAGMVAADRRGGALFSGNGG